MRTYLLSNKQKTLVVEIETDAITNLQNTQTIHDINVIRGSMDEFTSLGFFLKVPDVVTGVQLTAITNAMNLDISVINPDNGVVTSLNTADTFAFTNTLDDGVKDAAYSDTLTTEHGLGAILFSVQQDTASAKFTAKINSRPDDYILNVQASGTITCGAADPVAAQTFTVFDQTFTVKAAYTEPRAAGEVLLSTTPATFATNIAFAINEDLTEIVAVAEGAVVTVTAVETAPYIGTGGNVMIFENVNTTGLTFTGTGTLEGGVDEVKAYQTVNGIDYVFCETNGERPTVGATTVPVITPAAATMSQIAVAYAQALMTDTTAFSTTSVTVSTDTITANYKTPGGQGNLITFVSHLVIEGDITITGVAAGKLTGGVSILPTGLTMSSTGTMSGTPLVAETKVFVVTATDQLGQVITLSESVTITA